MKNKAFTFIEIMAVMIIIGVLFLITALNASKLMTDNNMARFKKGYASVENAVSFLISDKTIYGTKKGFKDIEAAKIILKKNNTNEVIETGEVIGKVSTYKFRDGFKYLLNVVKDNVECKLYHGTSSSGCFMTDDGVVFGIPNTDFNEMGTIPIKDTDGDRVMVVPITMYVNYDGLDKDPKKDAFIMGISYDGAIYFIRTFENCTRKSKEVQCKLDTYVNSNSITRVDEVN